MKSISEGASPMVKGTDTRITILAKDVLTDIQNGKDVKYDNVTIKGDLNISDLELKTIHAKRSEYQKVVLGLSENIKRVDSQITISNSIIEGKLNAKDICFRGIVNFFESQFDGEVDFNKSQFRQGAYFSGSPFNRIAYFNESEFGGVAYFSKCQFFEVAFFNGSLFRKDAYFSGSTFCKGGDFSRTKFNESSYFGGSRFREVADFNGTNFGRGGEFSGSKFYGDVNFRRSQFKGDTNFNELNFEKPANFDGSNFNKSVDFSDALVIGDLLFDAAIFDEGFSMNTNKLRFNNFYIKWVNIKNRLLPNDESYLSLVENYKKLGWMEDADECYYSYRVNHQRQLQQKLKTSIKSSIHYGQVRQNLTRKFLGRCISCATRLFLDKTARYSYGYGTKPERPIFWSLLIILCFGIIYSCSINGNLSHANQTASFGETLFFSANTFTSGASSLINVTSTNVLPAGNLVYIFTAERLLGWAFFVIFLASIGRTIIR